MDKVLAEFGLTYAVVLHSTSADYEEWEINSGNKIIVLGIAYGSALGKVDTWAELNIGAVTSV